MLQLNIEKNHKGQEKGRAMPRLTNKRHRACQCHTPETTCFRVGTSHNHDENLLQLCAFQCKKNSKKGPTLP